MPTAVMAANSPVERVVKLIEELKADLEKDEKVEQQIHDKYACWCKKATGHKAAAIHMNHYRIELDTQEILGMKSKIAVLAAEIAERHEFIAELEDDMKKATNIRQKENAAYMKETGELMQAINALERAIKVLSGAGTKTGLLQNSEALSSSERARAANLISIAVSKIPVDGYKALTPKKVSVLSRFTAVLKEDRESFQDAVRDAQEPEIPEGVTAADGSASYSPQSATVQGILKDMYDSFSADLESQTESESKANREFEALIAEKTEQVNHKNEEIMKREETKAATEAELADAVKALDDLTKTYEADKKLFDEMEAMCRAKHEEWEIRSAQRKEELEGIKEALKILTSDEARALFAKAIKPGKETSFLQLDAFNDESAPASKAYKVLSDQAKASHSIRLAALAAKVRTTAVGHFDEVITEIDKVIATLKEEEKEDIKQRDFCKEEYHKNDEEQADLKWKIKVNEEMIAKLEEKIAKLTENIQATAQEIKDTETQIKEMEDERISEHEAFLEAKSDDEAAVELLGKAIEAMSKFYKKEGVDMGPIQGSSKLLQEPEFEIDQFQAPDAKFSDKGKRKNQSKGIISILTMLKEDLEDEIKNGVKDEVAAQAEFEKSVADAKALIKDLTEKKIDLENARAETDEQKGLEHDTMEENKGTLTDKQDYRKSITEGCDWILGAFEERVQKRKAEMEGLVKAKEYLAGAAPPAMLETSERFDDNKLSEISFHGVSFLQRQ
eukprot:gnl/MRDRNA2_/MRDRNA2_87397_c0_seq1.p1 gnl/MRDRNA2_/MRDRNA2_87397_c0~~gnl/MRDRNA2_/MRDRNA2_87397_c0_seq1.p1  ORF type:complete len:772 (-),score=275.30 gnl/MRDRNA2_/MRDRNA2_87397_c0_seq1:227-2425(-)